MIKKRIENHINDEYNYRLNLKSEIDKNVESPEVQDFLENYKEKTKTYRLSTLPKAQKRLLS